MKQDTKWNETCNANVDEMEVFVIISKDVMKINADVNVKN